MTTAETSAGGACIPVERSCAGAGAGTLIERSAVDGLTELGARLGEDAGPEIERPPDTEGEDGERGGNISVSLISVMGRFVDVSLSPLGSRAGTSRAAYPLA